MKSLRRWSASEDPQKLLEPLVKTSSCVEKLPCLGYDAFTLFSDADIRTTKILWDFPLPPPKSHQTAVVVILWLNICPDSPEKGNEVKKYVDDFSIWTRIFFFTISNEKYYVNFKDIVYNKHSFIRQMSFKIFLTSWWNLINKRSCSAVFSIGQYCMRWWLLCISIS